MKKLTIYLPNGFTEVWEEVPEPEYEMKNEQIKLRGTNPGSIMYKLKSFKQYIPSETGRKRVHKIVQANANDRLDLFAISFWDSKQIIEVKGFPYLFIK